MYGYKAIDKGSQPWTLTLKRIPTIILKNKKKKKKKRAFPPLRLAKCYTHKSTRTPGTSGLYLPFLYSLYSQFFQFETLNPLLWKHY